MPLLQLASLYSSLPTPQEPLWRELAVRARKSFVQTFLSTMVLSILSMGSFSTMSPILLLQVPREQYSFVFQRSWRAFLFTYLFVVGSYASATSAAASITTENGPIGVSTSGASTASQTSSSSESTSSGSSSVTTSGSAGTVVTVTATST